MRLFDPNNEQLSSDAVILFDHISSISEIITSNGGQRCHITISYRNLFTNQPECAMIDYKDRETMDYILNRIKEGKDANKYYLDVLLDIE